MSIFTFTLASSSHLQVGAADVAAMNKAEKRRNTFHS